MKKGIHQFYADDCPTASASERQPYRPLPASSFSKALSSYPVTTSTPSSSTPPPQAASSSPPRRKLFTAIPPVVFSQLVTEFISTYLDAGDICTLALVCRASYHGQLHPRVWRNLTRAVFRVSEASCLALENLCSTALAAAVKGDMVGEGHQTVPGGFGFGDGGKKMALSAKSYARLPRRGTVYPVVDLAEMHEEEESEFGGNPYYTKEEDEEEERRQSHRYTERNAMCTPDHHHHHHHRDHPHHVAAMAQVVGEPPRSIRLPVGDLLSQLSNQAGSTIPAERSVSLQTPSSQLGQNGTGRNGFAETSTTRERDDEGHVMLDDDDDTELVACHDAEMMMVADRSASTPATRPNTAPHRPMSTTAARFQQRQSDTPGSPTILAAYSSSSAPSALVLQQHETTFDTLPNRWNTPDRLQALLLPATPARQVSSADVRKAPPTTSLMMPLSSPSSPVTADAKVRRTPLVCAATAAISLTPFRSATVSNCAAVHFPWKEYFISLFTRRVTHVIGMHKMQRVHAVHAVAVGDFIRAERFMSEAIGHCVQAGCAGINELVRQLVRDLNTRGHIYRKLGRDEEALGDYSLAWILDPNCMEAYSAACELASVPTGGAGSSNRGVHNSVNNSSSQRRGGNLFLSPQFNFEQQYDAVVSSGTVFERAAFIFESMHYRGPECAAYVIAYILCDSVKYWPCRLLRLAHASATCDFQRLLCHAWRCFDNGQPEKSGEYAELAVELLPKEYKHNVELLLELSKSTADLLPSGAADGYGSTELAAAVLRDPSTLRAAPPTTTPSAAAPPLASFAYFTLAFVSQQCDVAIDAYRKCLLTHPFPSRKAVALNNLASLLMSRGDLMSAKVLLEASIDANAKYFMTYRNLAKCLTRLGDREAAYQCLTQAINVCRPLPADAFSERSKYSTVTAAEDLDAATRLNPRMSYPYRLRAALLMDRQRDLDALRELDKALEIGYDAPDAALRAVFKRDLGDVEGAISDMSLAIALCPTSGEYVTWLRETLAAVAEGEDRAATAPQTPNNNNNVNNINNSLLDGGFLMPSSTNSESEGGDGSHSSSSSSANSHHGLEDSSDDDEDDREEVPNASLLRALGTLNSSTDDDDADGENDDDIDADDIEGEGNVGDRPFMMSPDESSISIKKVSDSVLQVLLKQHRLCMHRTQLPVSSGCPFLRGRTAEAMAVSSSSRPAGGRHGRSLDAQHLPPLNRTEFFYDASARTIFVGRHKYNSSDKSHKNME